MAKKTFDIAALLGAEVSKLDTGDGAMRQIALDLIDENEKNFFHVDDIAELADSISLNGLLQPLVVRPTDDGRYRLIAGHRRRQALLLLREADATVWRTVPCVVVTPSSDALEELMLIQTNTQSRELDWSDRNRSVERTEAILLELQEKQGVKLPGKMRTRVAEILKVSESAIARGKVIEAGLIDKWKKRKPNEDVAYRLARLPKADQLELYKHTNAYICGSTITAYLKAQKEGRDPWAPEPEQPRTCYHGKLIDNQLPPCDNVPAMDARNADETLPVTDRCGYQKCCWDCFFRFDCPDCCA
ncbi:MAG: ParB N-terminal domain-containing protein, partial [Oscillospiraceae bacterium]